MKAWHSKEKGATLQLPTRCCSPSLVMLPFSFFFLTSMPLLLVSNTGVQPAPREGHAAAIVSKYMIIAGGCGLLSKGKADGGNAASGSDGYQGSMSMGGSKSRGGSTSLKRLCDVFVLDLFTGECCVIYHISKKERKKERKK